VFGPEIVAEGGAATMASWGSPFGRQDILRNRAREMGMRTLREDGIRKVQAGLTTPDEVIRATVGDVE
jgi:hypothetical protein